MNRMGNTGWFKSSASEGGDDCVEVAFITTIGVIGVRDSKDPEGPVLYFTEPEWRAFVAGVKNGEFDIS